MKPRLFPWSERWQPQRLGRSLPVAPALRLWALGLLAAALVALAALAFALHALGTPSTEPAEGAAVAEAARDRVARVELPVWEPGAELAAAPPPEYLPPPVPPLATRAHPGDPATSDGGEVARSVRAIGSTAPGALPPVGAVTALTRAAEAERDSWLLSYDAGVALSRSGFDDRAARFLARAQRRVERYQAAGYAHAPAHHAADAATRYAAGHATLRSDCVDAIQHFKLAVSALDRYVAAGGAEVFDRKLPFPLDPVALDSLDVWMALAWGYVECEDRYPAEYVKRVPRAKGFLESEYRDPKAREIADGPFSRQLARCVEEGGASSRCWALSNLNRLWLVNRSLVTAETLPAAYEPHRATLARLAYDVALLAATGATGPEAADREGAGEILRRAQRLVPRSSGKAGGTDELRAAIAGLGRHLATEAHDYTLLAEAWRGRAPGEMPFVDADAEQVKGMAWALRERWQGLLAAGQPETVLEEVELVRQRVPGVHLDSLAAWEKETREALRDALAEEIRVQKRRGNRANRSLAAGLRDFRAPWLGEAWPGRAAAAWWTPGLTAVKWVLIALYALFLVALAVVYRSVVYPYLVYTTDFYRTEMERRRRERRAKNLPVTGEEIFVWRRERR